MAGTIRRRPENEPKPKKPKAIVKIIRIIETAFADLKYAIQDRDPE